MSESVISQNNNSLDDNLSATETVNPKVQNDHKDNGDAQEVEDSPPAIKKIKLSNAVAAEAPTTPGKAGRPSKAAVAKRLNILEKTAKEGEALLQNLGHKGDDNPEGNRRQTRSQTRGTPAVAPTPPKKEKAMPKTTPSKDNTPNSGTPKRRGRPPKNSVTNNSVDTKTEVNTKSEKSESTEDVEEKAVTINNNNSNETNNNTTNDVNPSEESNSTEPPSKDAVDAKPAPEEAVAANEQTNEVSAKTNSISDDTSKSVPVLDTQQPKAD